MKRTIICAAIFALGAQAFAQESSLIPVNANVRFGLVYPLEDATRNATGNMFGIGIDFFSNISLVKGGKGYFSFDYASKGLTSDGNFFISAMYNQRFPFSYNKSSDASTYLFGGVGLYLIDVTRARTVWGARGGLGSDLGENLFAELTFTFSGDADGAKANSAGIFLGYKF